MKNEYHRIEGFAFRHSSLAARIFFITFLFVQVLPCGVWKCRYWSRWQMSCVLLTEWLWIQNLQKFLRHRQTKCHSILAFHSLTSNYKYSQLLINSVPGPLAGEKETAMLWEPTPLLHLAHFSSWKWFTGLKNAYLYCCGKVHISVEGKKQQNKGWFWKNGFCVSIKRHKGGKADDPFIKGWMACVYCICWRVPASPSEWEH